MFGRGRRNDDLAEAGRDTDRLDVRLDPVRWRWPARGTLLRSALVTVLLAAAAAVAWSRPTGCAPARPVASAPATPRPSGSGAGIAGAVSTRAMVPPGTVGVPVRLADPAALRLLRAGDRVDLLGVDPSDGDTTRVADDTLVIGVTGADDPTAGALLLALDRAEANRAVAVSERIRFAVLVHPSG
jgi:hypothetical protein